MQNDISQLQDFSEATLAEANQLLFDKGKTFYWARFLLNKCHAQRATRLYRFCRYVDDLADEALDVTEAKKALKELISEIETSTSENAVVLDALALFNECNIEKDIVIALINGVYSDLHQVRITTIDHLLRYCYQVAGTVGLMMCKVLDINDESAYPYAIDLGIAMQLTNICRDISDDAKLDRRYLPESLVGNIEPLALMMPAHAIQQNLMLSVEKLLSLADEYYASGNAGLSFIPLRARTAILLASRLYQAIGRKQKKQNYQYWLTRAMLSKPDKAILTIKTLMKLMSNAGFWQVMETHQPQLHQSLSKLPYTHAK